MDLKAEAYIAHIKKWHNEMAMLREILLNAGLQEEFKWGRPCYTIDSKNIAILYDFKSACGIGFFKGALMKDPKGLLKKQGEHSQSSRIMNFQDLNEIAKAKSVIIDYIKESIKVERSGLKQEKQDVHEMIIISELQELLDQDQSFKKAFASLTPGRQRGYHIFFSAAKQSETRISRIKKYKERILQGYGLNDCTCGLSKKMPTCDGSHKFIKQ